MEFGLAPADALVVNLRHSRSGFLSKSLVSGGFVCNRKFKMLSDDSVRPHQHIRRYRQADLLGRFQVDARSESGPGKPRTKTASARSLLASRNAVAKSLALSVSKY